MKMPKLTGLKKRTRAYVYKEGEYTMSTSFKSEDSAAQAALIDFVGRANDVCSQKTLAALLRCSASTVSRMVRIYHFKRESR